MINIFELGREARLSEYEIIRVLQKINANFKILDRDGVFLFVEIEKTLSKEILESLGGSISTGIIVNTLRDVDSIAKTIDSLQSVGKIQFSLRGPKSTAKLGLEVKKKLKLIGRSVRYIEPNNTATIIHNNLVEKQGDFIITSKGLFLTTSVQDIEGYTKRDYERPAHDALSGMLPPKLARMMINITNSSKDAPIYDPFCGSGTVLIEAGVLGYTSLYGSDISDKAIKDTQINMSWLQNEYKLKFQTNIFIGDIINIHKSLPKISAIVTEPYLGKPLHGKENISFLENQARNLGELYTKAFDKMHSILIDGGIIVIAIPFFQFEKSWIKPITTKQIERMGFINERPLGEEYLSYHRVGQHIGRAIHIFRKVAR